MSFFFMLIVFFVLRYITECIRSLLLYYIFLFEAIKISIEYLVRADIKADELSGFSLKFYRYYMIPLFIERSREVCATQTENESLSSFQKKTFFRKIGAGDAVHVKHKV